MLSCPTLSGSSDDMIEMSFRRVLAFQQVLEAHKVACTGRVQRGVDIAAACGQFAGAIQ